MYELNKKYELEIDNLDDLKKTNLITLYLDAIA